MVERAVTAHIPNKYGDFDMFVYTDHTLAGKEHVALVHRMTEIDAVVPVRIHSECLTGDIFTSSRCDCGEQLHGSMRIIADRPGVLIYLRQEGRGIGLINKLKAYNLQDTGLNTVDANIHLNLPADAREYSIAVAILQDLRIRTIDLITNNPEKISAIEDSPIVVNGRIPIEIPATETSAPYLDAKRELMGHLIS